MIIALEKKRESKAFDSYVYAMAKANSGIGEDFFVNFSSLYDQLGRTGLETDAHRAIKAHLITLMRQERIGVWSDGYFSTEAFDDPMQDAFNLEAGPAGDVVLKASDILATGQFLLDQGVVEQGALSLRFMKTMLENHAIETDRYVRDFKTVRRASYTF